MVTHTVIISNWKRSRDLRVRARNFALKFLGAKYGLNYIFVEKLSLYQNIVLVYFYAEKLLRNLIAKFRTRTRESRVYFQLEITTVSVIGLNAL